ncbi:hypothetical protein G6F43_001219 [Rhizopus delemar]|nr:hypothetical protein G6F43_001219 [Rhizopus delemar]
MVVEEKKRKHKDNSEKKISTITASNQSFEPNSSFSEVVAKIYIHLAPIWAGKAMEGVNEQLNAFLMKHVAEVDGVILAHSDIKFVSDKGKVMYDSPFCHFFISVKFLVWKPKKGTKLVGRINLQSEDHIGLLIYGTFNASIPKSRIPSSTYEWKVNEEDAALEQEENTPDDDVSKVSEESTTEIRKRTQYGEWVNKNTGAGIGREDGSLEFDVVDVIEANDILTVTGSL